MGLFSQRAAAFSWNTKGECFGVLMSREGQKFKVLDHWSDKSSGQQAVSSVLLKGYKKLKVTENDYVVAGEMGMRCSFVDIKQPLMNPKDMKKSLNFTLAGHFPIDPVDLSWAYRVVSEKDEAGLAHIRLLAMKSKNWNDWVDHIGNIKLDTIVSPAAVADSVIDKPVYIPISDEKGFVVYVNGDGKLHSDPVEADSVEDDVFGAGDYPLSYDTLDAEEIADDEQQKFSQTVLLGMYALTDQLKRDRETSFEVPQSLIPKRNAVTKSICGICLVLLFLLGIFQLSRVLAFKKKEAGQIDVKIQALQKEAKRNSIDVKKSEAMTLLREELDTKVETWASARDALAVVSDKLPKNFFLSSFTFRSDKVTCKVLEVTHDPASESILFKIFKEVEFFDGDVEVTRGSKDLTLSLVVRKPEKPEVKEEEK